MIQRKPSTTQYGY